MWPLVQIVLFIFTSIIFHICVTDPNTSSANDHVPDEGVGATYVTKYTPVISKTLMWIITLYQVLYLFLQAFLPSFIPILYPQISMMINPLPWTPTAIIGFLIMIIGGLGRIWCYKTLGRLFTFQISIRDSHKLIKTGPYAYMRHPSYTFAGILLIGFLLVHRRIFNFFPNTLFIEYIFNYTTGFILLGVGILFAIRRVKLEEEGLLKTFGNEWNQYAAKTKRFIPKLF